MLSTTNYAIQFAITAGVCYFVMGMDNNMVIQIGALSVLSSVAADMAMPYVMGGVPQ